MSLSDPTRANPLICLVIDHAGTPDEALLADRYLFIFMVCAMSNGTLTTMMAVAAVSGQPSLCNQALILVPFIP
jgi:hypothetical protein